MILHVAYQDLLKQTFFLIAFARARGQNLRSRPKFKIRQLRGLRWKPNQTTPSAVCDDAVSGFGENHPASIDVSHLAYHMLPASSSAPSQTILKVSLRCSESFCVRCELPGVIRVTDTHTLQTNELCRTTSFCCFATTGCRSQPLSGPLCSSLRGFLHQIELRGPLL